MWTNRSWFARSVVILGARPIDQHIKGFEALGAKVDFGQGKISAKAKKLVGTSIYMDVVSVGSNN